MTSRPSPACSSASTGTTAAFVIAPVTAIVGLAASLLNALVRIRRGGEGARKSAATSTATDRSTVGDS
ncbi:hypothetical protein [Pseudonocardia dioxanivorans]|uniref:hypothetical protein n=1 Tax=Pseudonocardia dioxanivorans TaxID=240495 RepID=UPI00104D85C2|nr:hypothetical protein [Pseudonocardia dioxanivorans]